MKNKIKKEKEKGRRFSLYFLGLVIILYLFIFCLNFENAYDSLKASGDIFIRLLPILFLVVFLMGLLNHFLKPKSIAKYLGKGSGAKGWILATTAGIISVGPIYVWFPLLKEFRNQGMSPGLAAVFLYNRAIKIPLLPVMIYYFGAAFAVLLLIFTVIASLIEGKIIEMLEC
jgi:uncharacterized membrane protein YraQ (UPF0718 family)